MKFVHALAAAVALTASQLHAAEPNPAMQAFLQDEIMSWANEAVLIDAIVAQNGVTGGYDAAQIEALDQAWRAEVGGASTPTIDPVLNNAASDFLREKVMASGGTITEVFIMDAKGLNVATSGITSDYWQGDEEKHQLTYGAGAGSAHFSEIEFDESSQSFQAQISLALTDGSGALIGAMTVGVNADAL